MLCIDRMCIDRIVPKRFLLDAYERSVRENPANRRAVPTRMLAMSDDRRLQLALVRGKLWDNGRVLRARFLDGTAKQRRRVLAFAKEWERFAHIRFQFAGIGRADIRISFGEAGSWSAVGTDALVSEYFRTDGPTMNFGWIDDETPDAEFRRVVLHEFGHALGAIHEHQSPAGGIAWNRDAVYRAFSGPPNFWSREEIDHNVLSRYSRTQANSTTFDRRSIMLYAFPGSLTLDGRGTEPTYELSARDKSFMTRSYPRP